MKDKPGVVLARAASVRLSSSVVTRLAAMAIGLWTPSIAISQTAFTCQTDSYGEVCLSPPSIQYGIFGVYQGVQVGAFGGSRDEACLNWAAKTPSPFRRAYLGVRPYGSSVLIHCLFEFKYPNDERLFPGIDGDNREIRVSR